MQFTTQEDIDLPADQLFDAVADFDALERLLRARGVELERLPPEQGTPMAWEVGFDWRGRRRDMRLEVTRFDRPSALTMSGRGDAFDVTLDAEVVPLAASRARLVLTARIAARSMKARLLLQTAKLTKGTLDRRFEERVGAYLRSLADGAA